MGHNVDLFGGFLSSLEPDSFGTKDVDVKSAYTGGICASNTCARNTCAKNTFCAVSACIKDASPKCISTEASIEYACTGGAYVGSAGIIERSEMHLQSF